MNFKKSLSAVLLLVAALPGAFAVDLGTPAVGSPYEAYMSPVKSVLRQLPGKSASMGQVREWMKVGKGFRYTFTEPYVAASPIETARTKSGDCKAKSLWLMSQLGDRNARYVIGKGRRTSKISHAWVMWKDGAQWWILDCTNTSKPIAADSVSKDEYIAYYSYDARSCYRHGASQLLMASNTAANLPVAADSQTSR